MSDTYYSQHKLDGRSALNRRIRLLANALVASLVALLVLVIATMVMYSSARAEDAARAVRLQRAIASCYGPGLYGNSTANGTTLTPRTIGVAHRSLRFGTKIEFRRGGRVVIARVIDRGPAIRGRKFDLTSATVRRLGVSGCYSWGVRGVQWRIVR